VVLVERANATDTRPWLIAHEAIAAALPLVYLLHRRLSRRVPSAATIVGWSVAMVALALAAIGLEGSETPRRRVVIVDAFSASETWKRPPGQPDPRDPFFPSPVALASGAVRTTAEALLGPHAKRDAASIARGPGADAC